MISHKEAKQRLKLIEETLEKDGSISDTIEVTADFLKFLSVALRVNSK